MLDQRLEFVLYFVDKFSLVFPFQMHTFITHIILWCLSDEDKLAIHSFI